MLKILKLFIKCSRFKNRSYNVILAIWVLSLTINTILLTIVYLYNVVTELSGSSSVK